MPKIKFVSDSTADIPKNICKDLDIEIMPLSIICNEKEYLDGTDISPLEFYDILDRCEKLPTSSRPAPRLFYEIIKKSEKEGYTDLIYVCLNSKGSSTCQGAVLEKNDFFENHPDAKIKVHVIDSLCYSMQYGCATIEGAKLAKSGKSASEIIEHIKNTISSYRLLVVPMSLKFARKSGRISAVSAFVGDALGLKPIISFEDGQSVIVSKIRGEKKISPELISLVQKDRIPDTPYYIINGRPGELTDKFQSECRKAFGNEELIYNTGCVISLNIGPDTVGIIYKR